MDRADAHSVTHREARQTYRWFSDSQDGVRASRRPPSIASMSSEDSVNLQDLLNNNEAIDLSEDLPSEFNSLDLNDDESWNHLDLKSIYEHSSSSPNATPRVSRHRWLNAQQPTFNRQSPETISTPREISSSRHVSNSISHLPHTPSYKRPTTQATYIDSSSEDLNSSNPSFQSSALFDSKSSLLSHYKPSPIRSHSIQSNGPSDITRSTSRESDYSTASQGSTASLSPKSRTSFIPPPSTLSALPRSTSTFTSSRSKLSPVSIRASDSLRTTSSTFSALSPGAQRSRPTISSLKSPPTAGRSQFGSPQPIRSSQARASSSMEARYSTQVPPRPFSPQNETSLPGSPSARRAGTGKPSTPMDTPRPTTSISRIATPSRSSRIATPTGRKYYP